MLIECNGIKKDRYLIPPFTLSKGEFLVLDIFGGAHFYELSMFLAGIFSGKIKQEGITVHHPLNFVPHFKEPAFRRLLYPVTIKAYIDKHAGPDKKAAGKMIGLEWLDRNLPVHALDGGDRKLLCLYITLSHTRNIVFDLAGVGATSAGKIFDIVKAVVKEGGAAMLLDNAGGFKEDCTKFIQAGFLPGSI